MRGFLDAVTNRSWNVGWAMFPMDVRVMISLCCCIHYISRHNRWMCEREDVERTMLRRWGGSVESVRKSLSKEDQIRVRTYVDFEDYCAMFIPNYLLHKPAGFHALEGEEA